MIVSELSENLVENKLASFQSGLTQFEAQLEKGLVSVKGNKSLDAGRIDTSHKNDLSVATVSKNASSANRLIDAGRIDVYKPTLSQGLGVSSRLRERKEFEEGAEQALSAVKSSASAVKHQQDIDEALVGQQVLMRVSEAALSGLEQSNLSEFELEYSRRILNENPEALSDKQIVALSSVDLDAALKKARGENINNIPENTLNNSATPTADLPVNSTKLPKPQQEEVSVQKVNRDRYPTPSPYRLKY